jgi:hypothetical protein
LRNGSLVQCIKSLLEGQIDLIAYGLDPAWEGLAEANDARLIHRRGTTPSPGEPPPASDYLRVDLERVAVIRPRSVGAESVALETLRRLALDTQLAHLGLNYCQVRAAIGVTVARMAYRPLS